MVYSHEVDLCSKRFSSSGAAGFVSAAMSERSPSTFFLESQLSWSSATPWCKRVTGVSQAMDQVLCAGLLASAACDNNELVPSRWLCLSYQADDSVSLEA
jgi:hypothetical protein